MSAHYTRPRILRNDVRCQLVLDPCDLVFQAQFSGFQAAVGQLIGAAEFNEGLNRFVQIAVFLTQHLKLDAQNLFVGHFNGGGHAGEFTCESVT